MIGRAFAHVLSKARVVSSPDRLASLIHDGFMTLLAHSGETLDRPALAQPAAEDAGEAKTPA